MRDELIDQMERVQREHFWFRARARILHRVLRHRLRPGLRVLDAGCGTGLLLAGLPPGLELAGLDISPRALEHARARLPRADLRLGSLPDAQPFAPASQDLILLTDVLEHIEDDHAALVSLGRVLAPGGHIVLTVPAYSFLWSRHDEEHGHFRRYSPRGLRKALERAGLRVEHLSPYNSLLFPMVLAARLLKRITGSRQSDMEIPPPWLNAILFRVFSLEQWWVGRVPMPVGVSLIAIACVRHPRGGHKPSPTL